MNKESAINKEKQLMTVLIQELEHLGNRVTQSPSSENGLADIACIKYVAGPNNEPVLMQLCFLPSADEKPENNIMIQAMTIRDNLKDYTSFLEIKRAVEYLNYVMPFGCFVIDPEGEMLSFRRLITIPEALDAQSSSVFLIKEVHKGVGALTEYLPVLSSLIEGDMGFDELVDKIS